MLNSVNLTGRLTKDPELRNTQSNIAVSNFTIAVNRSFTDANGERGSDFINIVTFKKTAEIVQKYLRKGSLVGISGRLQSRSYENKDGQRVFVTEVIADNVAFLETKQQAEQSQQSQTQQQGYGQQYQQQSYNQQPQAQYGQQPSTVDIGEDDLPF